MNCEYCGASNHKTEDCPVARKAKLLAEGFYYEEGDDIVVLGEEYAALFQGEKGE